MIKALKTLIGLAAREDATTEEIAPSLPQAELELAAAREARTAADADYKAKLLSADDATLRQLVDARANAGVRVDRAEALVAALRERLEAAKAREAEAARVVVYEAARAQADEARALLAEIYPQLAKDLVSLMSAVAEAETAVTKANANLPTGAAPIAGVEASVRNVPAVPEKVLSETHVERWVEVGRVVPGALRQDQVRDIGGGRGVLKHQGLMVRDCPTVERRSFTEQRVLPATQTMFAYDLATKIALPGLRADEPDYWSPLLNHSPSPREVLAQIAERATALSRPAPRAEAVTRLVPEPGARPVADDAAA